MNARRLPTLAACVALGLAALPASALEVTGDNVTVSPTSSTGPCPATFTFRAKVALNKQGTFTYKWERSDGAVDTAPHAPAVFDGVHAVILEQTWKLGAPGAAGFHPFHGWMKLHVLTPQNRVSEPANFTLDCGAPPPTLPPGVVQRPTVPGGAQLPPPKN